MIKIFCDCCGKEIDPYIVDTDKQSIEFSAKRVRIEPHSNVCGVIDEFLVELTVTAKIYKPKNLMDSVYEAEFLGDYICPDCIVERIIQRTD